MDRWYQNVVRSTHLMNALLAPASNPNYYIWLEWRPICEAPIQNILYLIGINPIFEAWIQITISDWNGHLFARLQSKLIYILSATGYLKLTIRIGIETYLRGSNPRETLSLKTPRTLKQWMREDGEIKETISIRASQIHVWKYIENQNGSLFCVW